MSYNDEWFNDNAFWETFAPIMFDEAHWEEVPTVADGVIRLAKPPPARCLDLCCGFGRIGLELARRNFSVTGVDITQSYLEAARKEAAEEELRAEFLLEDVRSFKRPGEFDIAVNLYNSFGYFEKAEDDRLLVHNAYESLKPGGLFIIETLGKEIQVRDFIESEWFRKAGYLVFTQYEILDSWNLLKNHWRLLPEKGGTIIEKTFNHRLYAATELRKLFFDTGFSSVEIYGDWDKRPYDNKAIKLIIAGKK